MFPYVPCGVGLVNVRARPVIVGSNIASCMSKGIPPAGLFGGRTRFQVNWNPSCPGPWNVNAAAASTSISRSLTTGEVTGDIMTLSTLSINFFDAVCAIHGLDWGRRGEIKSHRLMKRLFEFRSMMAHSLAALNCAGGSAYLIPSQ